MFFSKSLQTVQNGTLFSICNFILEIYRQFGKQAMSHVTLEPMLFVKMIAEGNTIVIGDTLEIDRVCRVNLNFSQEDCMAMDDGNHSDVQVKD